jgi:hypothetical protein
MDERADGRQEQAGDYEAKITVAWGSPSEGGQRTEKEEKSKAPHCNEVRVTFTLLILLIFGHLSSPYFNKSIRPEPDCEAAGMQPCLLVIKHNQFRCSG